MTKNAEDKRLKFQKETESFLDSFRKNSYGRDWTEQKVRELIRGFDTHPWKKFVRNKPNEELGLETEKALTTLADSPVSKVGGLDPERKPTLAELEHVLRNIWQKGTTEAFLELIHRNSAYDKVEANAIVVRLIDEGKMGYDSKGWLVWVKGGP